MCADRQREIVLSRCKSLLIDVKLFLKVTLCVSEGSVGFTVFAYLRLRGLCLQEVVIGLGVYFGKGLLIDEELFLNVKLCVSEGSVHFAVFACLRLRGFCLQVVVIGLGVYIGNAESSSRSRSFYKFYKVAGEVGTPSYSLFGPSFELHYLLSPCFVSLTQGTLFLFLCLLRVWEILPILIGLGFTPHPHLRFFVSFFECHGFQSILC